MGTFVLLFNTLMGFINLFLGNWAVAAFCFMASLLYIASVIANRG